MDLAVAHAVDPVHARVREDAALAHAQPPADRDDVLVRPDRVPDRVDRDAARGRLLDVGAVLGGRVEDALAARSAGARRRRRPPSPGCPAGPRGRSPSTSRARRPRWRASARGVTGPPGPSWRRGARSARARALVAPVAVREVPLDRHVDRRREVPRRAPAQARAGAAGVDARDRRLVLTAGARRSGRRARPASARACARRSSRPGGSPPRRGRSCTRSRTSGRPASRCGEQQVALERVEHVLPRAARVRARGLAAARRPAPRG